MSTSEQDILYEGLPAVWDGERYVVFSPLAKKAVSLSKNLLQSSSVRRKLEGEGFFGGHTERVYNGAENLGLILTTACNLKCVYCYVIYDNKPLSMSKEYAVRILKEYLKKTSERLRLSFFGGEPTLNSDVLKAAVDFVKLNWGDYLFHITTNGTADEYLYDYLISENFYFTLSFDGPHGINDLQRPFAGTGGTNNAERTIRQFVKSGVIFQVRTTITSFNVELLPDVINYCAEQGVKFVHFEVVSTNPDNQYLMPDKDIYIKSVKRAISVAEKYNVFLINSAYMNLLTPCNHFCSSLGGSKILYTPDGAMSLCYKVQSAETANRDFVVGSYNRIADEFEVDYEKIKKMKALSVDAFAECEFCFARFICAGGCPNRNLSMTGDIHKPDAWMCAVKKELIRDAILRIYNNSRQNKWAILLGSNYFESLVNEKHKGGCHGRKERIAVC